MTRLQIESRVLARIDRSDSTTVTLVDAMINEVIRSIEEAYPFTYTKKSQEAPITADDGIFQLPSTLILHHPYTLLLEDSTQSELTLSYLVKVGDESFALNMTQPELSADNPIYWRLAGGTSALNFQVTPVQNAARDLRLFGGHYYTTAFTADGDTNWLTLSCPDVVIEGVCAQLFEHYGEPNKADRAYQRYNAYMNGDSKMGIQGLINQEKKMNRQGRLLRVKTLDDLPLNVAVKKKYLGY